ncbi:MAG: hypothetical protein ACXQTR_01110 [Candidatus Methanospirareceae archaeon]
MSKRKTRDRRERKRAGSSKRDSQHRGGGNWTTLEIPEGVDVFSPKAGSYRLDIIPYEVGEGNEYAEKGEWYYERTYFAHRGVGVDNASYVCPAKTCGQPCPICKEINRPDCDEELAKALKPKERQLFLIYDHDDAAKGVQLWDVSHFLFGNLLDKLRRDADEDEEYIMDFDDPEGGASLKVSFGEEQGGGYKYLKCYSIVFKPRPKGLPDEILDHGICLDSLLKIEPYERLKSVFLQEENDDEDSEGNPSHREKDAEGSDDDPWDGDLLEEEDEQESQKKEESKKPSKKGPKIIPAPEGAGDDWDDDWD